MNASRHQTGNMSHINHKEGTNLICDLPESGKINKSRIGAGTGHNHLGLVLKGELFNLIHVDLFSITINPIRNKIKKLSGKVDPAAMGQMTTMGQIHPQNLISWFQGSKIDGHIGLRSGMWLNIGILGAEYLFGS